MQKVRLRATLALLGATLLGAGLAPAVSRASVLSVDLFANSMNPTVMQANGGDTIQWNALQGNHQLRAYSGGNWGSDIYITEGKTATITFAGGTLKYYDVLQASLTGGNQCAGAMCGVISDHPVDVTPPTVSITSPANRAVVTPVPTAQQNGSIVNLVQISGVAHDETSLCCVSIDVYDASGKAKTYATTCDGCPLFDGTWTTRINLQPGLYTIYAKAADAAGNTTKTTEQRQIVVA